MSTKANNFTDTTSGLPSEMASLQARYGFQHHPFYDERAMQNPYLSFGRHQQLLYLHHLLAYSPYFIALVGEEGSGKTTFIHQFLEEVRSRALFDFHAFSGSDFGSKTMLLATLGKILKLSDTQASSSLDDLRASLSTLQSTAKSTVLIIDDANLCPLEVLETLVELQNCPENQQKLKFLLVGNASLNTQMAAIKDQVAEMPSLYLLPFENFNFNETLGYIKHHFEQAGVKEYGGFPKSVIQEISKESKGQPKRINDMVLKGLLAKEAFKLPKARRFQWPSLQTTSYTLSAIAIALMLLVIVQNGSIPETVNHSQPVAAQTSNTDTAALTTGKPDPVEKRKKIEDAPLFSDASLIPDALIEPTVAKKPNMLKETTISFREQAPEVAPEVLNSVESSLPAANIKPQLKINEAPGAALASFREPVSMADDIPALMNVDPSHFGIQVFGAWELNKARHFQKEKLHKVPMVAFVVETRRDERPWYILIAGEFETYSDAKTASQELPESVLNQQPWIRKYASIQSSAVKTHP